MTSLSIWFKTTSNQICLKSRHFYLYLHQSLIEKRGNNTFQSKNHLFVIERNEKFVYLGGIGRKLEVVGTCHDTWQIIICRFRHSTRSIWCSVVGTLKSVVINKGLVTEEGQFCNSPRYNFENKGWLMGGFFTFLTMVNLGFKTAKPPGGSRGAPVTNWQNALCCSGLNSPIISSN